MRIHHGGRSIRLPDFLIVGAARSGTTSFSAGLAAHPGIFMPGLKEPMFFTACGRDHPVVDRRTGRRAAYVIDDLDAYLRLFRPAGESRLTGEASTWYLYDHAAAIRMMEALYGPRLAELRILMILRDPVARAWSHYSFKRRNGEENLAFEEAVRPETISARLGRHYSTGFDYLGYGRYHDQVKAYLDRFPRVRVYIHETWKRDPAAGLADALRFLGLDPAITRPVDDLRLNVSGKPRSRAAAAAARWLYRPSALKSCLKPFLADGFRSRLKYRAARRLFVPDPMPEHLRLETARHFREDIERLGRLLRMDLAHWTACP